MAINCNSVSRCYDVHSSVTDTFFLPEGKNLTVIVNFVVDYLTVSTVSVVCVTDGDLPSCELNVKRIECLRYSAIQNNVYCHGTRCWNSTSYV